MSNEEVKGTCKLCLQENVALVDSHIIPKFVFKWLKRKYGAKKLRRAGYDISNTIIVQDGFSTPLLCKDCDTQKFGAKLESNFANKIFHPILTNKDNINVIKKEDYLLKFCVSVLWRALLCGIDNIEKNNNEYKDIQLDLEQVSESWRRFLLDERDSIDEKVYLLKLNCENMIDDVVVEEYLEQSIDMSGFYLCQWEPKVYAKLGHFIVIAPLLSRFEQAWIKNGIYPVNSEENDNLVLEHDYDNLPVFFKGMLESLAYQAKKKNDVQPK